MARKDGVRAMSEAEATFNIKQLIKSLDPEVLGKFEPLSGMLLINMSQTEYMAAFDRFAATASTDEDRKLISTINHETYHAIQTGTSGYCFDRQRRQFAVFKEMETLPDPGDDPEVKSIVETLRTEAGDDPELKRRADRAEAVMLTNKAILTMEARAAPGDNSVFGAVHPRFFRYQAELAEHETARNADGLSILGVLEGSAVAFTHQLMLPNGGAQAEMEAELATLTPVYQELYALTGARVGERALELMLPAGALALCYAEPQNAYCAVLSTLAGSRPGEAVAYGRKVFADLPALSGAGAILGTSIQVRRNDDSYHIYDKFIDELEAERNGVDAYTLLAEPDAMNRIGMMPCALVTADNVHAALISMTYEELLGRMVMMSLVLRVAGRRREQLEIENFQLQWAREVLDRLVAPPRSTQGKDESG